jgi:hypothetical protein
MVGVELNFNNMIHSFIVLKGTKKLAVVELHRTNWWKYRNWWTEDSDHNSKVTIHHKYCFNEDITIEYLEFEMELYPNKKVGLIWDAATQHNTRKVLSFFA